MKRCSNGIQCVYFTNFALFECGPMTPVEFNLIRVISIWIITATIFMAYCSFTYLLHGSLLHIKFNWCLKIELMCKWKAITLHCKSDQNISQESRKFTDTFLMAGKPFFWRECYHNGRLKNISIYNPTVLVISHVSQSNQVSKFSHFSLTDEIITNQLNVRCRSTWLHKQPYFPPIYDWYVFNEFTFYIEKIILEITETWKVSSSDVIFQDLHDFSFLWRLLYLWKLRNP